MSKEEQLEKFTFLDENGMISYSKLGYAAQKYMKFNPQDAEAINSFMMWIAQNVNRELQARLERTFKP